MFRMRTIGALCGLALPLVTSAAESGATVQMVRVSFQPEEVTIRQGETVEWQNASRLTHSVTIEPGETRRLDDPTNDPTQIARFPEGAEPFDSGDIPPGGRFRYTFAVPGSYRYICTHHKWAGMVGTVVVEQAR